MVLGRGGRSASFYAAARKPIAPKAPLPNPAGWRLAERAKQLTRRRSPQEVLHSDFGSHRSAFSPRLGAHGWIGMTWPKRHSGGERGMLERSSASDRHHTERGHSANKFGATL
jgi:alkylation response protein AidB-like acyl-CoA dehydrogenase